MGGLVEAAAVTVHGKDADMMGQPVEQCSGDPTLHHMRFPTDQFRFNEPQHAAGVTNAIARKFPIQLLTVRDHF